MVQLGTRENTRANIHCDYHYSVEFDCSAESCSIFLDCGLTMDVWLGCEFVCFSWLAILGQ